MALVDGGFVRDLSQNSSRSDVVLGEDWVAPDPSASGEEIRASRSRRGWFSLRTSPLTRKIITFNLIALNILVAGILYLSASRDGLVEQRVASLSSEARLVANFIEAKLPASGAVSASAIGDVDVPQMLTQLDLRQGVEVTVFDLSERIVGHHIGKINAGALAPGEDPTILVDGLNWLWLQIQSLTGDPPPSNLPSAEAQVQQIAAQARNSDALLSETLLTESGHILTAATPLRQSGNPVGVIVLTSAAGEIDALVRHERERVLRMGVVAVLVSIGLSLVLASTIANPLADLAAAAELGRDRNQKKVNPGRIRIPDLTARPDEIGRLSGALRGMIGALYNRIDGNEQFAADVAHEIKNPLASLRSAVGTLRLIKREDQRDKLLDVIEHDVRRLDRLVSDISNASRLDSELVKEEEETFDLLQMIQNISRYLGEDARARGIDFITDLPERPVEIHGLEARVAQVFVNLVTNAISFCEDGDVIRVWVRTKENRVLAVVEDTGPGIPDQALGKIFKRFYSQRPAEHFGNNSGLGLAISKQIVEAHGGVIWAENIRPNDAEPTSEPLGARFVVGLPV